MTIRTFVTIASIAGAAAALAAVGPVRAGGDKVARQSQRLLQLSQAARQAGLRLPLRQDEGGGEIARAPASTGAQRGAQRVPSWNCRLGRVYPWGGIGQKPRRGFHSAAKSSHSHAAIGRVEFCPHGR